MEHLLAAVAIFVVLYLVGRLTRVLVLWAMRRGKADRQVRTLVRNLITVTTYVVAVITALMRLVSFRSPTTARAVPAE